MTAEEIQAHRRQAEEAVDALEAALRAAQFPVPPGMSVAYGAVDQGYGPRLYLGTMGLLQTQQWVEALRRYARIQGFVVDEEARTLVARVLSDFHPPAVSGDGAHLVRKELE
ncbi:hypothetical protein [Kitasatospora aureofaciens]|uniref:hypothetical protein n=1 Tax=Kitasatospora aureofaciens TaxID=1894 RepID=UPI0036F489FA